MSMVRIPQGDQRPKVVRIERRGRPPRPYFIPEPMSGVLWKRLIDHADILVKDERIITELGRMYWRKELTTQQVVGGFRAAEIYGQFENSQGLPRRNVRSPAYDAAYRDYVGRTNPGDARENWRILQGLLTHEMRSHIEALCVSNISINPTVYEIVRRVLDRIATTKFKSSSDKDEKKIDVPLYRCSNKFDNEIKSK